MRQISMHEVTDAFVPDYPKYPECYHSCVHFTAENQDYYPGTLKKRCTYGRTQCGTSGDDLVETEIDGWSHMWCRFYERREAEI